MNNQPEVMSTYGLHCWAAIRLQYFCPDVSMYICPQTFATANHWTTGWCLAEHIYKKRMARLWVYVIHFPVHSVGVNNMSPHYNLSPASIVYKTQQCQPLKTTQTSCSQLTLLLCQHDTISYQYVIRCMCIHTVYITTM